VIAIDSRDVLPSIEAEAIEKGTKQKKTCQDFKEWKRTRTTGVMHVLHMVHVIHSFLLNERETSGFSLVH
jgi:hypothetical protein